MTQPGKTVLIVEDEEAIRQAGVFQLEKEGFKVFQAENGEAGLKQALEHHPDLILLDILMPKMTGIEMLIKLRDDSWGESVPVILLTNVTDHEKVAEAVKLGVHDYLIKSDWQVAEVVKAIKKRLKMI